ncbi:ISL3 family transposase [Mesorhizobium sp. M0496]|uniref:ISL3 family transposase n=1 Tax=Mesorhizobium sp. M0496 TaxID=2956952 RepID=UPI00333E08D8
MLDAFRSLISPELSIVQIFPQADRVVLVARPKAMESCCPCCGRRTRRVHSHYMRRLADLPWQGRVIEIQLHARRFRCADPQCPRRIFTERLPETVQPKARRTVRLGESQLAIGFAVGGEPGSRLSDRLAMPVSGDTLLRMIRAAGFEPPQAPRVVGIDDWAWRKGQRYGTIICDLERNRVLDLLPDRNADTVASWLERHPGIEIIARDRAGVYAEGARSGAPDATQVADRWHLLPEPGRSVAFGRRPPSKSCQRRGEGHDVQMAGNDDAKLSPKLDCLRRSRRNQRSELYAEILQLREAGLSPRQIAPQIGLNVRTVERWLAAGGEPEHRRPPWRSVLMDPFRDYLEKRWEEGQHNGLQLWTEIKHRGFEGSRATVYRWTAARKERPPTAPPKSRWRPPSRRNCAWLLSEDPTSLARLEQLEVNGWRTLSVKLLLALNFRRENVW